MHDACTISLSDHLTPWETIVKRVEAAASADFVIALYNPRSGRRTRQIVETQSILLRYRDPQTPVGLVKSAYRERQQVIVTTLEDMLNHDIGMLTTVIIGNSSTTVYDGLIVTPRGYQRKYTLDATEQVLKPHQRLRTEAEPWSLGAQVDRALDAPQGGGTLTAPTEPSASGAAVATQARPQAMAAVQVTPAKQTGAAAPASLAAEALGRLAVGGKLPGEANTRWSGQAPTAQSAVGTAAGAGAGAAAGKAPGGFGKPALFEVGVSPGVGNKKFTARQMALLAEVAGDDGELEYTPDHQIVLRVPCADPEELVGQLRDERFIVMPIGDVFKVKACDFCNMEKDDAVPVAEHLQVVLGGLQAPKETSIALNGCGMACYGAVLEDIGIVYRKGGYDLFLGGKKFGRNAHAAQPVAEGIRGDQITDIVENIIAEYKEKGHPNERFHKFFKRVGIVAGFRHEDAPATVEVNAVCGD